MTEFLEIYFIFGLLLINFFAAFSNAFAEAVAVSPLATFIYYPAIIWRTFVEKD